MLLTSYLWRGEERSRNVLRLLTPSLACSQTEFAGNWKVTPSRSGRQSLFSCWKSGSS